MFGRKSENILIIKTDGLAAFVAAEPAFEEIRKAYPSATISLLTEPKLVRVAKAAPYFDQVASLPDFHVAEVRKAFMRQIKNSRFKRVFDLSADDDGKRLSAAMGPFRPKWYSVDPSPRRRGRKQTPESALPDFASFLEVTGLKAPARRPDFRWALDARKDSANMQPAWFGISGAFGLLLPSADPARRWPAANYAGLAKAMSKAHIMPVLAGGKELHSFGDEVAHEAPEIVDLAGKCDHLQLTALAQEAAFFVSDAAEEVHLVSSIGCSGVVIRKAAERGSPPEGRHIVTLTTSDGLGEASAEFVWRTLDNMGLIPAESSARRASAR